MSAKSSTRGAGRPQLSDSEPTRQVAVYCVESQRDRWRELARAEGRKVSDVARELLEAWADRVEKKHRGG